MNWLPDLVLLSEYHGDWDKYVEVVYQFFRTDFVESKPTFQQRKVVLSNQPPILGKEVAFWHLISEGDIEEERLPDLRRCERIRWPRPIIEKSQQEPRIKVWENKHNKDKRICLWLEDADYLVILGIRKGYYILITAYMVEQSHRKRKLQAEYAKYLALKKADAASN